MTALDTSITTVAEIAIAILISGSLFALVATGFTIIYRVTRVLDLAYGVVVLSAGYAFWKTMHASGSLILSSIVAIIVAMLIGVAMHTLVYERMHRRGTTQTIMSVIAAVALLILGENTILALFGSGTKTLFTDVSFSVIEIAGARISTPQLITIILPLLCIGATALFIRWTPLGQRMRAVADQPTVAAIVGIPLFTTRLLTVVLASALAGVAGILFAVEYNLIPGHATVIVLRAFARAIVGGVGSIPGAVFGSFALEAAENIGAYYFSAAFKQGFSFLVLFLFLFFRPRGLFGGKVRGEEE